MARRKGDEPHSQRSQRKFVKTRDQHGRVWEAVIERETLHPVGAMRLVVGEGSPRVVTDPPLLPPQNPNVMKFRDEEVGYFEIAYDSWLAQHDGEVRRWYDQLQGYAVAHYGEDFERYIDRPSPALLRLLGPKPAPREQIIAAREAHPWALGHTTKKPSWASKYFPRPVLASEVRDDETQFLRDGGFDPDAEAAREAEEEARRLARIESAIEGDEDADIEDDGDDLEDGDEGEEGGEGGLGPNRMWPRHHKQAWWILSDGNKVQGRSTARNAQRELDAIAEKETKESFAGAG